MRCRHSLPLPPAVLSGLALLYCAGCSGPNFPPPATGVKLTPKVPAATTPVTRATSLPVHAATAPEPVILYVQGIRADVAGFGDFVEHVVRRLLAERQGKSVTAVIWPDGGRITRFSKLFPPMVRTFEIDVRTPEEVAEHPDDIGIQFSSAVPDPAGFIKGLRKCGELAHGTNAEIIVIGHDLEPEDLPPAARSALAALSSHRTVHFIHYNGELKGLEDLVSGYVFHVKRGNM
jgi:hypothetical protein